MRELLVDRFASQRELALAAGCSETTVSRFLNAKHCPTISVFLKLAQVLERHPAELYNVFVDARRAG